MLTISFLPTSFILFHGLQRMTFRTFDSSSLALLFLIYTYIHTYNPFFLSLSQANNSFPSKILYPSCTTLNFWPSPMLYSYYVLLTLAFYIYIPLTHRPCSRFITRNLPLPGLFIISFESFLFTVALVLAYHPLRFLITVIFFLGALVEIVVLFVLFFLLNRLSSLVFIFYSHITVSITFL